MKPATLIACMCLAGPVPMALAQHDHGAHEHQAAEPVNAMCPVGKEPIVPSAGTVEYKGKTIGLCCPGCGKQFLAWDEARKDEFVALAVANREPGRQGSAQSDGPGATVTVTQIGRMRDVMRDGETQARVQLGELARNGIVALGALEGLSGEITILDGEFWVTRVAGDDTGTTGPALHASDAATLLTWAIVPAWYSRGIEIGRRDLEAVLRDEALAAGVDLDQPFPFIIEPTSASIAIHVVNGFCPASHDPKQADTAPWRWSGVTSDKPRIVGFFAQGKAGEMTHHGTEIHAHAVIGIDGETTTAHIDTATLAGAATLRLPADRVLQSVGNGSDAVSLTDPGPSYPYPLDTCPVSGQRLGSMGDPIVKKYDGREVRFCCAACIDTFEADLDASWKKVDEAIARDQMRYYPMQTCVVSGEPLVENGEDVATNIVYNNRLVRLCCRMCERELKADPKTFMTRLDKATCDAQRKDYPLDTCVVAGGELGSMGEPTEMVVAGRLMRFCCASCEPKVKADPAKYITEIDKAWQAKGKFMPAATSEEPDGEHDGRDGHGDPIPAQLPPDAKMLDVPDGLIRIFDRDLVFAGIARVEKRNGKEVVIKTDERGRTIDIHALRHTFGTHLCAAGVPHRTAQAAMRHSDPSLTANVYTDPKLLDVAGALEALPRLVCVRSDEPAEDVSA